LEEVEEAHEVVMAEVEEVEEDFYFVQLFHEHLGPFWLGGLVNLRLILRRVRLAFESKSQTLSSKTHSSTVPPDLQLVFPGLVVLPSLSGSDRSKGSR